VDAASGELTDLLLELDASDRPVEITVMPVIEED